MERRALAGLALAAAGIATAQAAEGKSHKAALHVGSGDPAMMRIALNNINALIAYFAERNETVAIELVANGPGYTMLRADKSPVAAGIAEILQKHPTVVFAACQNTRRGMAAAEGKKPDEIPEVPGITDVPAGVGRLIELQEQGYGYIRV